MCWSCPCTNMIPAKNQSWIRYQNQTCMKSFKKYPMPGPDWYEKVLRSTRWQDQSGMKSFTKYPDGRTRLVWKGWRSTHGRTRLVRSIFGSTHGRTRLVRIFLGSTHGRTSLVSFFWKYPIPRPFACFPKTPYETNTDLGFRVFTSKNPTTQVSMKFHKMFTLNPKP